MPGRPICGSAGDPSGEMAAPPRLGIRHQHRQLPGGGAGGIRSVRHRTCLNHEAGHSVHRRCPLRRRHVHSARRGNPSGRPRRSEDRLAGGEGTVLGHPFPMHPDLRALIDSGATERVDPDMKVEADLVCCIIRRSCPTASPGRSVSRPSACAGPPPSDGRSLGQGPV